jgi:FMN phosphatase YigB (HAD superfamily)
MSYRPFPSERPKPFTCKTQKILHFKGMQTYIFAACYTSMMKKISTIIFDLGGVLLDLDQGKTLRAFNKLGLDLDDVNESASIFTDFETGKINAADFRQGIQTLSKGILTSEQIDHAWNLMLLETTEERFRLIEQLRKHFRVYLLSNTNSIHIDYFKAYIEKDFGWNRWSNLFDKQYLSYEMGMRKPHKEIYQFVLNDIGREAKECIFVDDNITNIKNAGALGIHTILAQKPLDKEMFDNIHHTAKAWKQAQE